MTSLTFLTPYWSGREMMRAHLASFRTFYPTSPILVSKRGGARDEMEAHRAEFGITYWLEECEYVDALLRLLTRCETDYVCIVEHDTVLLSNLDGLLSGVIDGRWDLVGMEERVLDSPAVAAVAPSPHGWWRFAPGQVAGPVMMFDWRRFERRWGLAGIRGRRSHGAWEYEYDYGIGQKLRRHKYLIPFHVPKYGAGTVLKDGDTAVLWHQWYGAYRTRLPALAEGRGTSGASERAALEALAREGEAAFLADCPKVDLSALVPAWGPDKDIVAEQEIAEAAFPHLLVRIAGRPRAWRRLGMRGLLARARVRLDRWLRISGASIKRLVQRVPGLVRAHRHVQLLSTIIRERWFRDPKEMQDRSIINREWCFEDPSEQERYQRVLSTVGRFRGPSQWGDVLEIGCAEGLFTGELVRRAGSVTACDVSAVACERTAKRWPAVAVRELDIQTDRIPGRFDVVFAMCVFAYVHGRRRLDRVTANVAGALRVGGLFVVNELRLHDPCIENCWWARWSGEGGVQLMRFLNGRHGLHLVHEQVHGRYVIGVYEKRA